MPRKTKVTLTIDSDILARAKKKKIDLAETFEHALRRLGCEDPAIADARAKKWQEENRGAIEQFNKHVEKHGLWWQGLAKPQRAKQKTKKPVKQTHAR